MSGLSYITTCSLCGMQFNHPGLAELIQSNPMHAAKIFDTFAKHIESKHKEEDNAAKTQALALIGLLRLKHFSSQDESAIKIRECKRWEVAESVRVTHVPDHLIAQQVAKLALPDEYDERVLKCVQLMRDIIEERGEFRPRMPEVLNVASKSAVNQNLGMI